MAAMMRTTPMTKDVPLIRLVELYLAENSDCSYVNVEDMVDQLKEKSFRYARMQRKAFSELVRRAYSDYCKNAVMAAAAASAKANNSSYGTPPTASERNRNAEDEMFAQDTGDSDIEEIMDEDGGNANASTPLSMAKSVVPPQIFHTASSAAKLKLSQTNINTQSPSEGTSQSQSSTNNIGVKAQACSSSQNAGSIPYVDPNSGNSNVGFAEEDSDEDLEIIEEIQGRQPQVDLQPQQQQLGGQHIFGSTTANSMSPNLSNRVNGMSMSNAVSITLVETGLLLDGSKKNLLPTDRGAMMIRNDRKLLESRHNSTNFNKTVVVAPKQLATPNKVHTTPMVIPVGFHKQVETAGDFESLKRHRDRGVKRKSGDDEPTATATKSEEKERDSSNKRLKKEVKATESAYSLSDFAGSEKTLEEICKLLIHLKHPEFYKVLGVTPPRGFLLHGPPGTGKTLLANAIAGELKLPMLKVTGTEFVSGISGESESNIRELFKKAVGIAPCIVFIDEIDSVTPRRDNAQREMERRIVAQLLSCIDELGNHENGTQVLLIGATNRIEAIDTALRRAGRFDREICLGIPDEKSREQILRVICKNLKLAPEFELSTLAKLTPGYVGADLQLLAREAAVQAINKALRGPGPDNQQEDVNSNPNCGPLESDQREQNIQEASVIEPESVIVSVTSTAIPVGDGANENNSENTVTEKDLEERMDIEEATFDQENAQKIVLETPSEELALEHDCSHSTNVDIPSTMEESLEKAKEDTEEKQPVDVSDTEMVHQTEPEPVIKIVEKMEETVEPSKEMAKSNEESPVIEIEAEVKTCELPSATSTPQEYLKWIKETVPMSNEELSKIFIVMEDFEEALKHIQPSSKREGFATVPDTTWGDVGALAEIREELEVSILGPVKFSSAFEKLGLNTPAGVLLCGPPGCGKTLVAKAVANEARINFISVKGPELLNMYVGESERAVRQCFIRAKSSSPCVIFFDEIDALCPRRSEGGDGGYGSRIVNQLLTEMDGIEGRQGVFIMAATNRPDILDPAILRPGRLDKILFVDLPSAIDRCDILKAITKNGTKPPLGTDVDLDAIGTANSCEFYSGADLAALVREASIAAFKELVLENKEVISSQQLKVSMRHFNTAFSNMKPSVPEKDRLKYKEMKKRYSSKSGQQ